MYKENKRTIRYMGEWHTHPDAIPTYSERDRKNWINISKNNCFDYFYHIIVGYSAWVVYEVNTLENTLEIVGIFYW